MPDYEGSVGPVFKMMTAAAGNAESDPKKIARIVVLLSENEDVPQRLILDRNANGFVEQVEKARGEEAVR